MFRRLILAALISAGTVHAAGLPEPISALLQAAQIPPEGAGIVVMRGDTTLVSHNAQQSMQPASTMKLFTTMTALEQFGPAFRGRTEFRSSAEVVNGVLQGDLILRGGGDVDLNEDVLLHMLQALRNQGIRKIKGDVILDRQLFQPARPDVGQPPFDEFPWAYYNVIPDALLTNTNLLKVEMRSTGNKVGLVMMPEMDKVSIRSDMKLSDAPCASWEQGWRSPDVSRSGDKIEVVLHGSYPKNCIKSTSVDVLDHHDYLERLLRATWRKLGGSIAGDVREADASEAAPVSESTPADTSTPATRLLAEHVSRPLPEMLRDINKFSDNTLARTVFLMLGSLQADPVLGSRPIAPDGSQASTPMRAENAIRGWLQSQRIDANGLVFDNGAGLSRTERATPAQLAGVLQAGLKSLWMPEFLSSLPIAATDGTMRKRLKDSPAALRARIKTGSLKSVIAIAGYVTDANNQPCIVVAILNDEHVANGAGRTVLDGVIDWVSRTK
ncbi:D-alanyl-D-alanine carboxypeptidase/D-alanyl-D-alanine-endopeptidase [Duganella violaceipulchra]|uniref:D-alanyl-D-alanine carboxypeptidase/D-alanyl-D-alanine-endopeptidase n=1 Tax=Duganella violaceipulchra TaxID=2849652 RepID=A0AA41HBQ4_9BURK|nr:D-alanyl-D-alanine carboxypeptidase/D-alanyl-D-alanine-endopeptidase [Duganella violaceicalia]MBV6320828.1 D-alanyl-D-alanine carboxypeptidase/D-alanyl-D-alanine-endopeptidase [Duganella violaceicalia]MCP2008461.1 D-alanyl-D-alanine carboxypeptidase/D-alanyl-D-alanine-endopeptidase (penicillin-binding protein 4) [Duganella violaceicalia]